MAEAAIFCGIAAGETEYVIDGAVFLHLRKDAAEIVGVEEGFSAGVGRERGKRVLGGGVAVEIVQRGCARVGGLAVQTGVLSFAARRKSLEAADIQRIDGGVGLRSEERRVGK